MRFDCPTFRLVFKVRDTLCFGAPDAVRADEGLGHGAIVVYFAFRGRRPTVSGMSRGTVEAWVERTAAP